MDRAAKREPETSTWGPASREALLAGEEYFVTDAVDWAVEHPSERQAVFSHADLLATTLARVLPGFAESAPIASAAEKAQNKRTAKVTAAMNWMRQRFKRRATEERKRAATEVAALNCAGRMTRLYCLFAPNAPTILPSKPPAPPYSE